MHTWYLTWFPFVVELNDNTFNYYNACLDFLWFPFAVQWIAKPLNIKLFNWIALSFYNYLITYVDVLLVSR